MSAPVWARNTSATVVEKPGMLHSSSRAARKGAIASSMRASSSSNALAYSSIRFRCMRIKNP
jgi:hypothetical protein